MGSIRRLLAAGLCAGLLAISSAGHAQTLRIGAGQQGSQNYGVNAALAQALESRTGLSFTVQSYGGPAAYLPLIEEEALDMAAVVTPDLGDAVRGTGPFEGMAMRNLRLMLPLFPSPVGLMVAAKSSIGSVADLAGKRVASGYTAQASLAPYAEGALANGGLSAGDVRQIPVTSVANGVDELVSGRVDATLFALRGGKVVEADSALGGIRWLPLRDEPEAVAAMRRLAPEAYLVEARPGDALGIAEPMHTMAYDYALIVGTHVPEEAVAAVTKALLEDTEAIRASNKILADLSQEGFRRRYEGIAHHDGARKALGIE
jgi:uncharacterized protein